MLLVRIVNTAQVSDVDFLVDTDELDASQHTYDVGCCYRVCIGAMQQARTVYGVGATWDDGLNELRHRAEKKRNEPRQR